MRLSLRNRLALVFFVITLVAIAALYLYVAPGLQSRLVDQKLSELSVAAQRYSGTADWSACPTTRATAS